MFDKINYCIMVKVIKISELISTDIRSRANANIIRSVVDGFEGKVVLDFNGVDFISRSFTDELYNVLEEQQNISLENTSEMVKAMLDAVGSSRKNKRNINSYSDVKEFDNFAELSSFLATI